VEAIESALNQDYPNFEVIVSDNYSTDDTERVVRKYLLDPRFRYYCNEANLGSGPNYRKLLYEYANGQFGHFLADDDYFIDSKHLTKAISIIKKYGVKVVFSGAESRYHNDKVGRTLSLGLNEVVSREWWLRNLCRTIGGLTIFPSCGSGTLFEISKAKDFHAFVGQPYGDYEFALKCILYYPKVGYIREPQYVERRHEKQDGRTSFQNAFQGTLIFNHIYDFGCELKINPQILKKIRLRGLRYFTRGFLLHNWILEKGNSLSSFINFLRELKKIDQILPWITLFDINAIIQFAFYGSITYEALKRIYLNYRSWRINKKLSELI